MFRFLSLCAFGLAAPVASAHALETAFTPPTGCSSQVAGPRRMQANTGSLKVRTDVYVVEVDDLPTGQRSIGLLRLRDHVLSRLSRQVQVRASYSDDTRRELLFLVEDTRDGAMLEEHVVMRCGESRTWLFANRAVRLSFEAREYR